MENVNIASSFKLDFSLDRITKSYPELEGTHNKLIELKAYLDPIVYWVDLPMEVSGHNSVTFEEGLWSMDSRYVAKGLYGCHKATLIAATIGDALPGYSERCIKEGRLWEGTIADIFGSCAVETTVEEFQRLLCMENKQSKLYSSPRFSPGYGDWSLKDQARIVEILGSKPRISVSSGYMLEPVKSITALLGWSRVQIPQEYPTGNKGRGMCRGAASCSNCQTWACLKK